MSVSVLVYDLAVYAVSVLLKLMVTVDAHSAINLIAHPLPLRHSYHNCNFSMLPYNIIIYDATTYIYSKTLMYR
jgi:hypothetical protein